jgi:hypothetical protein
MYRGCLETGWAFESSGNRFVWRKCISGCCTMLVHNLTSLAELDKRKWHLPDDYLPTSYCGRPGSVPGNQCGIYGAQCKNLTDSSPSTSFYSCQYLFTNVRYLFVCLQMTESLNNTRKMDWACIISVRRQGRKDQTRDVGE